MTFKKTNKFLTYLLLFLTFFLLGIGYSYYFLQNSQNIIVKKEKEIVIEKEKNTTELNLEKYNKVYDYIKEMYYDFDEVKSEDLVESSIDGLVKGLKDPHTEYFNAKASKDFKESLSGDFEGIGAVLEKVDQGVKILSVIEESPAQKADLKDGDVIVEVNGQNIKDMGISEVITLIKGPAGKDVNLKFLRSGKLLEKSLKTGAIVLPSVKGKELDKDTGYIVISTFGEKTGEELKKELEKLKNKKGIIIDLRNNGGGYLEVAVDMLSNFIKKGDIVSITKHKDGKEDKYYAYGGRELYNGKVVMLVNGNSASASEIFVGAMKDYQKAILVGEKTFGKGSVQEPIPLSDGSMVKITTAKWFTPKDKNIDKEGIEPDIEVKFTDEDIKKENDRQLEEAKKVLKSFIENTYLNLSIDKYKENNKN
ncbi:S41 family peptidase [Candidatus Gracilibacteria bacterium]|nr:MAG: S41 family peptidase [Candidatus Gracilibacteria bacterium]